MIILCVNVGSSTIKYSIFDSDTQFSLKFSGTKEGTNPDIMFNDLASRNIPSIHAIGHRIVHGGPDYFEPVLLTSRVREDLQKAIHFAPLHLPQELAAIDAISVRHPELPQVLCFDTAFHHRMPEIAKRFPLPEDYWNRGIRRYGFHGLSYEYIVDKIGPQLGRRTIIAHLGNGASMVALLENCPLKPQWGLLPQAAL